ncbi:hypothetical protein GCM10010358_19920 [Streptomyces minutiscleroticus]|uniref:Uncharacterized protein n=1 Tax=Streptomyces minutiscleroticus TaxID=68238 RepID=A0A918NE09_9ACTN|nr:SUKH-4 family immunity protein [Streptomyces minutiscleroticus]GGX65562.1 hypothetical protein GCM10010358_19920 [Streptomyces minutiscleroticus]
MSTIHAEAGTVTLDRHAPYRPVPDVYDAPRRPVPYGFGYGEGAGAFAYARTDAVVRAGADAGCRSAGPFARVAEPGAGLVLKFPSRLLEREFGAGRIMRFEDVDFPSALTHGPTRRFLREHGLPEEAGVFRLGTDMPLPTLAEHYDGAGDGEAWLPEEELPAGAGRLIRLGGLAGGRDLLLDGTTGTVLVWRPADPAPRPFRADVSALAFTLCLLHRERRS